MKLVRKTKRLIIRPMRLSDYRAWRAAHLEMLPQLNRWDVQKKPPESLTIQNFKKILASRKENRNEDRNYGLEAFENKTGNLVGGFSVMHVIRGVTHMGFLGYAVYNQHWGKGFGKEAGLAVIDIAFRDLNLHRIEAGVEPENRRSIFLARALGLRKEGLKKRAVFQRKKWVDLIMYSATCEEFGIKWKSPR